MTTFDERMRALVARVPSVVTSMPAEVAAVIRERGTFGWRERLAAAS